MSRVLFVDIPTYQIEIERAYLTKLKMRLIGEELLAERQLGEQKWVQGSEDFSVGLLTMANYLMSKRHEVGYCRFDRQNAVEVSRLASEYDVVGITAMTPVIDAAIEVASAIKRLEPTKTIVLGGYHGAFMARSLLEDYDCFSAVALGEGETIIQQILSLPDSLHRIPGIAFRDQTGNIVVNPMPECLSGQELPSPQYSLLGDNLAAFRFNINTVRGCSYRCAFCVNRPFWGQERYRPIEHIISELDYLSAHLPVGSLIHFSDNIFTKDRLRVLELCRRLCERDLSFYFSCDIRGRYIDKEVAQWMQKAGFVRVSIGFEDCDNGVLRTSHKDLRHEDNVFSAEILREHTNILVNAYWMVALPGSTKNTLERNIETVGSLIRSGVVDTVNSKLLVVYPGTPFFDHPGLYGITILSKDWKTYDRRLYPPMYRLESLSQEEIYSYFLRLEDKIIEEYCRKLGVSRNTLSAYPIKQPFRHTTARYISDVAKVGDGSEVEDALLS